MARLQRDDDAALHQLMQRWKEPLLTFLYRYTANWSVATDLAEETFVKVYLNRYRYEPKATFSTWLFSIAANLARNEARWRKRHPASAFAQETEQEFGDHEAAISGAPGPDDSADRSDRARLVREAIRRLPHDLRTIVLLSEYENRSHREIGEILGCSPKAVESRLYRARQRLRDELSGRL